MRTTKRNGHDLTRRSHDRRRACSGKKDRTESLASVLEKMQKTKRGTEDPTRRSNKSRRARYGREEIIESSTSGDLHENSNKGDIWIGLSDEVKSDLSKSVASLSLCNGDRALFACSGIAIESQEHLTRFVTSASLGRAFRDTKKHHDDFQIKVGHEGKVYQGFLAEYDLDQNFAAVLVRAFLDVNVAFKRGVEILPRGKVLALGRDIFGDITPTNVILAGHSSGPEDSEDIIYEMSEVWEGGPLFTPDGYFIGMNVCMVIEKAFFVSWGTILNWLERPSLQKKTALTQSENLKGVRFRAGPIGEKSNSHLEDVLSKEQFGDLESMGYPKPPMVLDADDMVLVNTFEETFGDTFPNGVLRKLSKKAASNIDRYVVALASFNGEKRNFACTGIFIEWNGSMTILTSASLVRSSGDENKIDENLRIEVLHTKRRLEGTLQHCSLHYNVALVSVKDCRVVRPANVNPCQFRWNDVAAVGRCFKSGTLMAVSGNMVSWSGTLDCSYIVRSSCKITKAGIGGPLVNLDGEVIGMNFYDTKIGTPFLYWCYIDNILAHFREKSKAGEVGIDSDPSGASFWKMDGDDSNRLSRWPVPKPCWRHRDEVDKDKFEDELEEVDPRSGRLKSYGYKHGEKVELYCVTYINV